ncbi:glucose-induced degradation protein 8 homolog isoform X1 [Hippocampus comes]|nr:PREDICTED: glucose-induced degradation protein 8 homolog isoform X1 [Hippocampus comes]
MDLFWDLSPYFYTSSALESFHKPSKLVFSRHHCTAAISPLPACIQHVACFSSAVRLVLLLPMMSYAEKPEDITKDEWMDKLNNVHIQRADMNRLIMNYLVTEGFKEAAEKFRMESGIEPTVDLDSLDERIKIREMILKGQIQEAIALINSLHPELLDTNRYLYFHLQQQHLIELIRLRETELALEFAQTQLAEQGEESRECLTEMERTLALLAFDNPEESPFGDLLNMMQRQKVWSEVNQAVLDHENRESTPKLAKLLKLLLWAQNELDQKKVKYPKMTDLSTGTIEDPK